MYKDSLNTKKDNKKALHYHKEDFKMTYVIISYIYLIVLANLALGIIND